MKHRKRVLAVIAFAITTLVSTGAGYAYVVNDGSGANYSAILSGRFNSFNNDQASGACFSSSQQFKSKLTNLQIVDKSNNQVIGKTNIVTTGTSTGSTSYSSTVVNKYNSELSPWKGMIKGHSYEASFKCSLLDRNGVVKVTESYAQRRTAT